MAKLIITGKEEQLKIAQKKLAVFVERRGLKMVFEDKSEVKKQEPKIEVPNKPEPKIEVKSEPVKNISKQRKEK